MGVDTLQSQNEDCLSQHILYYSVNKLLCRVFVFLGVWTDISPRVEFHSETRFFSLKDTFRVSGHGVVKPFRLEALICRSKHNMKDQRGS